MLIPRKNRIVLVLGAALAVAALSSSAVQAEGIEVPSGPGQAASQPTAQCADTVSCSYGERNFLPNGYRIQRLEICGADCTSQFWVSDMTNGTQLLEIKPVRDGLIAVGQGPDPHPPVRIVVPDPQSGDPACCPSQYADTTYTWDASSGSLVAGTPDVVPAADFAGWDALRSALQSEKYAVAFP